MAIKSQILISDASVKLIELISTIYNVMLLAFYRAIDQSKTIFNLVNGFMDEYEDESGIDTVNSLNESYNSSDDYYSPSFESSFDSETKLLLHLNNNVTDEIGKTITNNNVTFSDSVKKFGYSGVFNGSSSYLSIPDSDDFAFGTGAFTIDFWINFNSFAGTPIPFSQGVSGGSTFMYLQVGATNTNFVEYSGVIIVEVTGAHGMITGNWYHFAIIRGWDENPNKFAITINGNMINTSITANSMLNCSGILAIGMSDDASGQYVNGYIDEFRISKGIARWTSNFTPPISEYAPEAKNMILLSNVQVAESVPTSSRIVIFEEDVDSVTLNTDLKAYISRDNGTTYSQATLVNEGYYATSKNILAGLVDISGQPSGSNIKYKIETLNAKNLKIHGTGINWA